MQGKREQTDHHPQIGFRRVTGQGQRIIAEMPAIKVRQLQFRLEDGGFERHAQDSAKSRHYPTTIAESFPVRRSAMPRARACRVLCSLPQTAALIAALALSPFAHAVLIDLDSPEFARLQKAGVPVIDIRTAQEWEETGIVAGSRLLTFFDERGRHDAAGWLDKLRRIAGPEQPVVLICRSGNRTRLVGQLLSQEAGYREVYHVKTGIKGWQRDGGSVVPALPAMAACRAEKTC